MFDFHIVLASLSIFIAWKWGDWQNWKLYYSTILYMIIGDLSYSSLSSNKPLWHFESPIIGSDFSEFVIAFVCFPCTCFVFFALYSKVIKTGSSFMIYILFFLFSAFIYTSIEYLSFRLGFISYHNGWNTCWSFIFNCLMFPLLLLHYKKPLLVWIPSMALAVIMIYIFHLPFSITK